MCQCLFFPVGGKIFSKQKQCSKQQMYYDHEVSVAGAFHATFGEMFDISWPTTVYVKPDRLALCTHCFGSSTPC